MRVAVINTGTELLLGAVLNTHLTFIAREVFPLGLRIDRQLTVPDGPAIAETLAAEFPRTDIVFVTGGLGPTTDDITREVAAELLGLPLRRDAEVADAITTRLTTRGYPMTDRILRQAEVPEGALVLPNANGTAPGLYLAAQSRDTGLTPHLFLLPGPPRELQPMFRESVMPILQGIVPNRSAVECRTFRLAGVGESVVEAKVGSQLLALPGIELGYCARIGEVDVRVIGNAGVLDQAEGIIRTVFARSMYTSHNEKLEDVLVRLLTESRQRVSTAESCTGGFLAHRITNVPGSSAVFDAGYITYANEAKTELLGVYPALIEEHGAVSEAVARAMAEGALAKSGATFALAITGIAGPGGGSEEKPVGTTFVALAARSAETLVQRRNFQSDRESFKQLATQAALEMLRQRLLEA
jgi:nicotinamide-nucleotide amidase